MSTAASILAELAARGFEVKASGDMVLFRPKDAMTPDLLAKIKANKAALLAALSTTSTPTVMPTTASSRGILLTPDRFIASNPARQPPIDIIQAVYRTDPGYALVLRDAWHERVAICEIDGGLTPEQAEAIALAELRG